MLRLGNKWVATCKITNHLYCTFSEKSAKFTPSGVQWVVTGAVPLRVHPLYPFTWVRICTLAVCTFQKEICTSAD